jgi:nickel-dependent lactate racemase
MKIEIPYGRDGHLGVVVDDDRVLGRIHPNPTAPADEQAVLERALREPIGSVPLDRFLQNARDVLILVNDGTRPTPTAQVLQTIVPFLEKVPFRFLVACGSHREPTEEEFRRIFGDQYERFRDRIEVHQARRREEMEVIGTTSRGTEMAVNRRVLQADRIVVIGSVEPHYFAGFTGGRKSFLPGVAAFETIERNHSLALHREAHTLALEGNPVHEDMMEAVAPLLKREIFAIMTIVDRSGRVQDATAGDLRDCYPPAVEKSKAVFVVPVPEKAEVVVTVAPFPTDINLYQSQKALENGKLVLKENGIMILVSSCRDGIGDDTFARLLSESDSPRAALEKMQQGYRLGYHKAAKIAEICLWAHIWAFTELSDEQLEPLFIKPVNDLQSALDEALRTQGADARVLFLMEGSLTVPSPGDRPGTMRSV